MYDIFTYIYHKNQPNVGKYTNPMDPLGTDCFIGILKSGLWLYTCGERIDAATPKFNVAWREVRDHDVHQ